MQDDFSGDDSALLWEDETMGDSFSASRIHPLPPTDSELPSRHPFSEGDAPNAWHTLSYYMWNYRAFWMSFLCILYFRWSYDRDRIHSSPIEEEVSRSINASHRPRRWDSLLDAIEYGMDILWNMLGTALDYSRASWQMILESLRQYDAVSLVLRPLTQHRPHSLDDHDEQIDQETLRTNRTHYFNSSKRNTSLLRRRAASLPDLDGGDAPLIIPETDHVRTNRFDSRQYADPSLNDSQSSRRKGRGDREEYFSKWPLADSSWKRAEYIVRPLEPAFGRPEDYPVTWYIYHPVLRVVTKEIADAYDQNHQQLLGHKVESVVPLPPSNDCLVFETNGTVNLKQKSDVVTPDLRAEVPVQCSAVRSSSAADPDVGSPPVIDAPDRTRPLEVMPSVMAT
jgi:hypothetical protein